MKLDIYRNKDYKLNDAFDQAVMNLHIQREKKGYKSFAICGCEPGDGSTTVAINLAAGLAASGWSTVLVDGDMRKKSMFKRLNEETTVGLSNYLNEQVELDEIIYETTTEFLSYIPCGDLTNNPVRLLCSSKMDEVKSELMEKYDFVIFDMPAMNAAMDANVMAVKADACILVVASGETSKKGLNVAVHTLQEEEANLLGVIINKTDMDEYKRYRKNYDYFKKERFLENVKYATKKNKNKKA